MSAAAVALVLGTAAAHASWNLLLKGHRDPWAATWLGVVAASALGLLFATATGAWRSIEPVGWLFITASALLEVAYFTTLSAAYRVGEFSLVYPLARGTVPLRVTLGGLLAIGERPTPLGWIGVALVICGIAIVASRAWRWPAAELAAHLRDPGVRLSLGTGLIVAGYSVLNKAAMARVPPAMYGPTVLAIAAGLIAPVVARRRGAALAAMARREWPRSLAVGALMIASYLLVLDAMRSAKVAYVSSVREASIVIGALAGWALLREDLGPRRALGAMIMFTGIVVIARGG